MSKNEYTLSVCGWVLRPMSPDILPNRNNLSIEIIVPPPRQHGRPVRLETLVSIQPRSDQTTLGEWVSSLEEIEQFLSGLSERNLAITACSDDLCLDISPDLLVRIAALELPLLIIG